MQLSRSVVKGVIEISVSGSPTREDDEEIAHLPLPGKRKGVFNSIVLSCWCRWTL